MIIEPECSLDYKFIKVCSRPALFSSPPKSVCFLRLSAIGDVCHAVAAVQALQKYWPETKVTWIIGKVEAQLLQGLDNVELIVFDKKAGWAGMKSVWRQLKEIGRAHV